MKKRIGFIGLGAMGLPMAQNIQKAGYPLYVYNRTKEKAAPLLEQGALWSASPAELATQCDILISMVANDQALNEITIGSHGIFQAQKKPEIHISMSSISPNLSAALETKHREIGITFLSAPVTGRPERAKEGSIWIFLAGDPKAKEIASPILEKMSCKIYDLGERTEQASLFKLCNNFMILSFIETFSEAVVMLEKNGVSPEKAAEIWGSSLFDSIILHTYALIICKKNYKEGGFALNLGLKDMWLLSECAAQKNVPMPFLSDLHEKLLASMNLGRENYDWSAIALLTRELAGLEV